MMKLLPDAYREITGVKITTNMTGKMEGMWAITTSCTVNPFCLARIQNGDNVCAKCYADRQLKRQPSAKNCFENNFEVLTTKELDVMPNINNRFLRFESHGDVFNETQVLNYLNIVKANPEVECALWTKNIAIVQQAINKYGKPNNLQIVRSSEKLNEPVDVNEYSCVDKVFTVYDKEHQANGVVINCPKKCMDCLKCYKGTGERYINEGLK